MPGVAIKQTPMLDVTRERLWWDWLMGLQPWELHALTHTSRELDWHDDYIAGIVSLDELSAILYAHFDPEFAPKVEEA